MQIPPIQIKTPVKLLAVAVVLAGSAVLTISSGSIRASASEANRRSLTELARAMNGGLSEVSLDHTFSDMDPSMKAFAERYAPQAKPTFGLLGGATEAGPQANAGLSTQSLQTLSWDAAKLVNASIPFSPEVNQPARPFKLVASPDDRERAVQCLAEAVYYEAGFEPLEGQQAVAQVVLNRLRHPVYPKTVCGVVYQGSELPTGCQFTFTCDGALGRPPVASAWKQAREVAEHALDGFVAKSVGEATHYHAEYVVPYWLPTLTKLSKIGAHIFYRWPGGMGLPAAFSGRYAGAEPPPKGAVVPPQETLLAENDKPIVVADASPAPRIQLAAAPPAISPQKTLEVVKTPALTLEAAPALSNSAARKTWTPPSLAPSGGPGRSGF